MICSVHGKSRTAPNLIDDGNGGWRCAPGYECKTSDEKAPGSIPTPCRFFLQGRCSKGPSCPFVHDDSAGIGKGDGGKNWTWGKGSCGKDWSGKGWGGEEWFGDDWGGKGWKSATIQEGPCAIHGNMLALDHLDLMPDVSFTSQAGAQCNVSVSGLKGSFAHGESDVADFATSSKGGKAGGSGTKGSFGKGNGWGGKCFVGKAKGWGGKDFFGKADWMWGNVWGPSEVCCAIHNKRRSAANLDMMPDGSYTCRPGTECRTGFDVKPAMCSFWEKGLCTKGAECKFAHGEHEIGEPIAFADAADEWAGKSWSGKASDWGGKASFRKNGKAWSKGMPYEDYDGGARDRSRSPGMTASWYGQKPPVPRPPPGAEVPSLQEFVEKNGVDAEAATVLAHQPEQVQQYVIGLGPVASGWSPSAIVLSRIKKCSAEFAMFSGGDKDPVEHMGGPEAVHAKVEEFVIQHGLDAKAASTLRSQSLECKAAVVALGPAQGRNPPAMIMGRIHKFNRGEL